MVYWTEQNINYLKDNFLSKTHLEMANVLGTTEGAVKTRCSQLKLRKKNQYYTNETYFDTWSHDMAYILGYIMADGYVRYRADISVYSLSFCLSNNDVDFLHFANSQICNNKSIYNCIGCANNKISSVQYNSKHMMDRLGELGVINRKTGHETMKFVPDEWKLDFVRGYFDGDGSISFGKNTSTFSCFICSASLDIITELRDFFGFGNITKPHEYENTVYKIPFYRWSVQKKSELEVFRNSLYQTGSFCLDRKKSRLFEVDTNYNYRRKAVC